jgi:hydrogenase maturation protease
MAMVIGYGSNIRGDRAAGRAVAEAIALLEMPGVWTYSVDHLTRAHAEAMVDVGTVIFLGAYEGDAGDPVRVTRIVDVEAPSATHYVNSPESLLALFRARHGWRPDAWVVMVPAVTCELHASLSPSAEKSVREATERTRELLDERPLDVGRRTIAQRVRELVGLG